MREDLSMAGPGSPVSLQKILDKKGDDLRKITILVDGSGLGIAKDAPGVFYITHEMCVKQALYYVRTFAHRPVPLYILKYMWYMFNKERDSKEDLHIKKWTEEEVETVAKMLDFVEHNNESQQVLGLIQLISSTLNIARKQKKGVRIYLENPEVYLHPSRQSKLASLIVMLDEEYGNEPKEKENYLFE